MTSQHPTEVLIVGAGPTGLLLAYVLGLNGVGVRLIERREGPVRQSRAMVIQARSLEFYDMFGLADGAIKLGMKLEDGQILVNGEKRSSFSLRHMAGVATKFPFVLALPQDEHEEFLLSALAALGIFPEWNTELVELEDRKEFVKAMLRVADGVKEWHGTRWLVGCDGASSVVRNNLGLGFEGGWSEGTFFVADVKTVPSQACVSFSFGPDDVTLMLPVRGSDTHRIIGIVPKNAERSLAPFSIMEPHLQKHLQVQLHKLNWFSTYHIHHRVADRYRRGNCFIAGDAAHVHSPIGGQGMNTGLGDAFNLGWKLAAVVKRGASEALLDTYELERRPIAARLVKTTDRLFSAMVGKRWLSRQLRRWIAPSIFSSVVRSSFVLRKLFKLVSEVRINYRGGPLSLGRYGKIVSGDRLPWIKDLMILECLDGLSWSSVSFGDQEPVVLGRLAGDGFKIIHRPLTSAARKEGFRINTIYLVRPDGYIGLVLRKPTYPTIAKYMKEYHLVPS